MRESLALADLDCEAVFVRVADQALTHSIGAQMAPAWAVLVHVEVDLGCAVADLARDLVDPVHAAVDLERVEVVPDCGEEAPDCEAGALDHEREVLVHEGVGAFPVRAKAVHVNWGPGWMDAMMAIANAVDLGLAWEDPVLA